MSLRLRRTEQHGDGGLLLLVFYHGAVSATSATYQQHRGRLHGGIRANAQFTPPDSTQQHSRVTLRRELSRRQSVGMLNSPNKLSSTELYNAGYTSVGIWASLYPAQDASRQSNGKAYIMSSYIPFRLQSFCRRQSGDVTNSIHATRSDPRRLDHRVASGGAV